MVLLSAILCYRDQCFCLVPTAARSAVASQIISNFIIIILYQCSHNILPIFYSHLAGVSEG